jgi:hypothetical protein
MISNSSFWLYIFLPLLVISLFFGLQNSDKLDEKISKNKFINRKFFDSILFTLLFSVPLSIVAYLWVFPNVYIIKSCSFYEEKIAINPFLKINNTNINFGNHCYVINNSNNKLIAKTNFFGANLSGDIYVNYTGIDEEDIIKEIIPPNSTKKIRINNFDYLFVRIPNIKTFTEHEKNYKYSLDCN